MTAAGFEAAGDAMQAHARHVAQLAARVDAAAQAGRTTTPLGSLAYGVVGQAFAACAQQSVLAAIGAVSETASTGHAVAHELAASADAYREVERANTELLRGPR